MVKKYSRKYKKKHYKISKKRSRKKSKQNSRKKYTRSFRKKYGGENNKIMKNFMLKYSGDKSQVSSLNRPYYQITGDSYSTNNMIPNKSLNLDNYNKEIYKKYILPSYNKSKNKLNDKYINTSIDKSINTSNNMIPNKSLNLDNYNKSKNKLNDKYINTSKNNIKKFNNIIY